MTGTKWHVLILVAAALLLTGGGLAAQTVGWTLETPAAQWSGREQFDAAVFNNRVWIMGGADSLVAPSAKNDVWSSADGVTWTRATPAAQWQPRVEHTVEAFNGKLWLLGGSAPPAGLTNEVWSSADGITWNLETAAAPWNPRWHHQSVVFNNRLWVLGGAALQLISPGGTGGGTIGGGPVWGTSILINDVWSSADGVNWVRATAAAPWSARYGHAATVFANKIWVMGGKDDVGPANPQKNDVWSSPDGVTWTQETASAQWIPRSHQAVETFENRLWTFTGYDWMTHSYQNDVWASADGITWTQETGMPRWSARGLGGTAVFNNKLWVLGGLETVPRIAVSNLKNDVWSFAASVPQITSLPVLRAVAGILYTYAITVSGSPTPQVAVSGLPPWLTRIGNTLSGTPTAADIGTVSAITVTATNPLGVDVQSFQLAVDGQPPAFTSAPVVAVAIGTPYLYAVTASGIPAPGFSAGALPAWLSFNPATGQLSGTPSAADLGLSAPVQITADNGWPPAAIQTFQVAVNGVSPQIVSTAPTSADAGHLYTYSVVATGNPSPVFSVAGNPPWLTLAGGILSGTPSVGDVGVTGRITITASNGQAPAADEVFQITVTATGPQITSTPPLSVTFGQLYSYTIVATGSPPPVLAVSGQPSWLTLSGTVLSGTPSVSDIGLSGSILVSATNGVAPNTAQQFHVQVLGITPAFTSSPVVVATPGTLYSYAPAAAGTPAPVLSVSGTLPPWLNFDQSSGVLSGTPRAADGLTAVLVTLVASNGTAPDAAQTFTIDVAAAPGVLVRSGDSGGGCSGNGAAPSFLFTITGLLALLWMTKRSRIQGRVINPAR